MILDVVGGFAVSDLPGHGSAFQIDRGNAAIRRLEQRQALHRRARSTTFSAVTAATGSSSTCRRTGRSASRARRTHRLGWPGMLAGCALHIIKIRNVLVLILDDAERGQRGL